MSATFADQLHDLCKAEVTRIHGCPDASAAMTTELASALANSIALLSAGNIAASRTVTRHLVGSLPPMIFNKTLAVRDGLVEMGKGA